MGLDVRFAIISDLHIGLPHTIHDHPTRFHLVEWSIPALDLVLSTLSHEAIDFLLLPGDLTQHGEPENHQWLADYLAQLPYPVYVIPGNHDIPVQDADEVSIGWREFPQFYAEFGYANPQQLYYSTTLAPGLRLVGLNSNQFDQTGHQIGELDQAQLAWLEATLQEAAAQEELVLVMVHHNVIEHFPNQTNHPIGQRYMLNEAHAFLHLLRQYQVQLVFSGHLHVQDIATQRGVFDITTGSLVSFPHPYRLAHLHHTPTGDLVCDIRSGRVTSLPDCDNVQAFSRNWMGDRSQHFMIRMLTQAPLNLPLEEAQHYAPQLRDFWSQIADGDPSFDFPNLPPDLQAYFKTYEAHQHQPGEPLIQDNDTRLTLKTSRSFQEEAHDFATSTLHSADVAAELLRSPGL